MSNKRTKNSIWDLVTLNKTIHEEEPTNENINKKRRVILNNSQKLKSVQYKTNASNKKQIQIAKYLSIPKNYSIPSEYSSFPILRSTSYSNSFITGLNPVVWVDASDLTSILRDSANNVYQILDKSGNNNHLYQNTLVNQPKYHNGGLLFNSNQYLVGTNTFTQSINNISIFVILKQYNQSTNQGIISGTSSTATSDNNNTNAWALTGSDNSTSQYKFITNNTSIKNTNDITKTIPYGIYEIIINNNVGSLYYDGTLINTTTFTGLGNFTNLVLGARYLSSSYSNFFNGEIYEVLVLNSVLNTGNRYKVEKYLLDKWNTTQTSRTIPLTNIYTWLDASSVNNFTLGTNNKVLSWKDKNNNLNFTQSNASFYPVFDTNKVIFDNSYLSMSDTTGLNLNNFSIFYVFQENTHNDNAGLLSCINSLGQTDNTVTNGFALTTPTSGNVRLSINSINLTYNGGNPLTKKLYEFNVVNGLGSIFINGVQQSTTNFNTLGTGKKFAIGARQNSSIYDTSNPLQASIYELIILSTNTSYSQRNQIYSYLSEKWNITISRLSPAPNPTFWLDSNKNSSITVNGSNQITSWSDLSSNNYTTSINNTKPILQTVNGKKLAYFNGSDVSINFGTNLSGANNSIYVVFSANSSVGSNTRLISFNNGTNDTDSNTFNLNSNTGNNTLKYNSTSNLSSTVNFNNSLFIFSLQRNNNVTSIYINNYLIDKITNDVNYNFARLDIGSIFGGNNFWTGYIPEILVYTTILDSSANTGIINYLADKWGITMQPSLINEYILRDINNAIKYVPFTNIFTSDANYLTISDSIDQTGGLNLNISVPIINTLPNQLSIISIDPVYLNIIDKNVIYNLSLLVPSTNIVLPTLTYNNDYFAFINNTSYDITITGPNSLSSVINANTTTPTYFTNSSGSYNVGTSFTGFTCTLNQYDNNQSDTFIVYLGGWSSSLYYIKNLYVYDNNNYVATTGPIYFNDTYQCDFTQTLQPGTYTFVISDLKSNTGNIITSTVGTSVVINNPSATLDHYSGDPTTYIITLINWSNVFSDITTLDVWVSDNSSYTGSTYLLTTETIQENSGVYTTSFTHEFGDGYYWISLRRVTSIHNLIIEIIIPIVTNPTFNLDQTTHTGPYNVILGLWNDSLTDSIPTLYIFGYLNSDFSDTPILLLSVDSINITHVGGVYKLPFTYTFDVARTYYLSVSDSNNLSGTFNVQLTNHINPLTITATCNLTYGFINYNNVFTLTLSNNESYDLSLYRTKWFIYYADNNLGNNFKLISQSTLNNDQTITFTFNPSSSLANAQYFYVSNTNYTVLAIGNGNTSLAPIAYSYDVTNWYYAPSSIQIFCQNLSYPNQNVNMIASDGYLWVAGVNTGSPLPYQIAYSTNGVNWYGSPSGNTILNNSSGNPSLNYITLNVAKTVWVFIASNNTLASSSDGINWTKITPIIDGSSGPFYLTEYNEIVHDGTKWLMTSRFQVDSGNELAKLAYSTDLINWTTINIDPNPNYIVSIMYGNSIWVGTGPNTNLYYSYDGFDWISTTTTLTYYKGPIYFVNNRFFMATTDNSSTNIPFYTSTDGIIWTECTITPTVSYSWLFGNVIWYNNKYYASFQYDRNSSGTLRIIESNDGITWELYPILNNNFSNILSTASYTLNPKDILSTTPVTFTTISVTISENQVSGSTVPLLMNGLHGWYDGGDISTIINTANNVTTWQDKSGNNFNATVNDSSNTPVLQSTGGILFSGATGQYFNLPNNTIPYNNTSYTIIIVFSNATSGGFISGGNSTTTRAFNSIEITNTNYVSNLWSGSGTSGNLETSHVIQSGTNIVYADYYIGSTHNITLDVLYKNSNTPSARVQTNTNNKIGYSPVGGSLNGIISEILIFNRILTSDEKQLLEGYLTWKWDITSYLPWTHPYKFTQPSMMPAYSRNPLDYPGIVSWYDFGDANSLSLVGTGVNTVFDKNSNNYDLNSVSGVFPVFSNGVGVTFNDSQYIRTNSFIQNLDTFTIYVVFSQSVQKSNAGVLGFISSGNNDNTVGGISFNTGSGTNNFNVTNTNFNVSSTNTGITTNIYSIVCDAGVISIYYNGVLNGTTTISSSNGTSAKFIVGSRFTNNTLTNGLNGTLKEIMIYSLAASTQTRQELEGYLAQKWHLQFNLSANHPYRYISPGTTSKPLNPLTNNPTDRWYDGDDLLFIIGEIWYDKSLSKCQLTYTDTSINIDTNIIPGMNSIKFLGDDNYFNDDFGLSIDANEYTISFVFYMDSTIVSNGRILSFYNDGANDYDDPSSIGIGQTGTNSICLYYDNTNSTPITVDFDTFNFVSFIIDSVSGNVYSYLNGTLVSTDNLNISLSTTLLTIGNDGNSNGFTYKGYINEVVLHPYALKNDNRQVLEGYFAWKWELDSLLPVEHPYYDLPPIVSVPSFSPNQIGGLDIWSDANDLPNQDFIDGQTISNWPNRSTSSIYTGFSEATFPVFNRWGFNGLPTVTYTPGNYTKFINSSNQNLYTTKVATLLGISKNDGGNTGVITGAQIGSLIGYIASGKNGLVLNNNYVLTDVIPNNTNWDNYTMVKNPDGTIQFSNYDLNLPITSSYTGYIDLAYNNFVSGNSTISEVLVYSYNLPLYYVQKLQGYLTWKWGLQKNLSILHPFRFEMPNKEETLFTLKLGGFTSNINIPTLYVFDTFSSTLLTSLTNFYGNDTLGYFATFTYTFPRAQNYLTIANTNDMSGSFTYPIPTPLQISAKLTILVTPSDPINNWGYFNVSKTFSFVLKSFYIGSPVNFKNYYSTLKVYYSQYSNYTSLNLIGNATVSNDGTTATFTFNYNPSTISYRSLYFYFAYSDVPSGLDSATSPVYVFFDKTLLSFTLNRYSYYNPYIITMNFPQQINFSGNVLYVYYSKNDPTYSGNIYVNQTYITPINVDNNTSGTFSVTFPSPDTGRYYLTISNINQFGTRTINDINVNIALPIYVNTVNVSLNKNYGFYQSINQFVGLLGTYNNITYPFPTIRVFSSTVVATGNNDLTELTGSPFTIINNGGILTTNFNFDNSTLGNPTLYFYFTANTDQVPPFNSFTYDGPISFYDKTTLTFTLNHYDNSSNIFIVTANNWTSILNALSPLNVYILDSNDKLMSPAISLPLTFSTTYRGTFTFNFDFLDAGSYTIVISDSDLLSPYINYRITTPVVVTLIAPHFILQNSQFTYTQTNTISVTPFLPTQIQGLTLWLDAKEITASNESSVTTWSDNSSNGYDAGIAEGAPTYVTSGINGFPSVQFSTGHNMKCNIPINTFNNGMTIFIVYQSVGTPSTYETLITRTTDNFPDPLDMYNDGRIVGASNITSPVNFNNNTTPSIFYVNINNTNFTYSESNNFINIFNSTFANWFDTGILYIGTRGDYFSQFNGYISEILIYNNPITESQKYQVEGYLAYKWNYQLPTNHPFYHFSPDATTQTVTKQAFVPTQISNIALWLDASDSSTITGSSPVTSWSDKSGLSKNATGNGTLGYVNKSIVFNGSNSYFTLPNGTLPFNNSSYSYFIVAKINSTASSNGLIGGGTNSVNNQSCNIRSSGSQISTAWTNNNTNDITTNINFVTNQIFLVESFYDGTNRNLYYNGLFDKSGIPSTTRSQTNTNNVIGSSTASQILNGNIYEIIVFSRNVTISERQQIEGYLAHKWNFSIRPTLPIDITNLSIWLDAADPNGDGSVIANNTIIPTWVDKSGNNNNFNCLTGTGISIPEYQNNLINSLPAIKFSLSGTGAYSSANAISYTPDLTIIMVVNLPPNLDDTDNTLFVHGTNISLNRIYNYPQITLDVMGNNSTYVTSLYVPTIFYGTVSSVKDINLNGISSNQSLSANNTYSSANVSGSYTAYIGVNVNSYWLQNASVGEVIYFNKVLSSLEKDKIISYLSNKWNIIYPESYTHPYISTIPPILYRINEPDIPDLFIPTQLTGLALWLDGQDLSSVVLSGSNVSQWNDKSGLDNHATGVSNPQWQTTYGVSLSGSNSFTLPDGTLPFNDSSYSYYIVAKFTSSGAYSIISGGSTGNKFELKTDASNNIITSWDQNNLTSNYEYVTDNPILIESFYSSSTGDRLMYFDSIIDNTDTPSSQTQTNDNNTIGVGLIGIIYEIIVYSNVLTTSQQRQVEYYLSNKWSIYYDPTSIPNLFNWIDASDTNTLFQDTNGQIPVTGNSQSINSVLDKSSNNILFKSSDPIYSPKYDTTFVNNTPSINCYNNGNHSGLVSSNYYQKSEDITIFWYGTMLSTSTNVVWTHSSDTDATSPGPSNDISIRYTGNNSVNFKTNNDTTNCVLSFVDNEPIIYWATMNNGTILNANIINSDGDVQTVSYTQPNKSWTPGIGRIWLSSSLSNLWGDVHISEYIYYQRVLSVNEINNVIRYLTNKWNILIPSNEYNILSYPETNSTNQSITLSLSTYYSPIYLYYGTTNNSYYNLQPLDNAITGNNIYSINPSNNSFTFTFANTSQSLKNIYFYASTVANYTGVSGKSLPFTYVNKNTFSITLDHYDISTNVYIITLSGYNPLLLNQPLHVMAIKNNTSYINLNQILTLTSIDNSNADFTGSFTYTFDAYNIYNIVLTNSIDETNVEPNGDIYIESSNIYGFSLTSSISPTNVYPGLNSPNLTFTIPGLSSNLIVSDYIPTGNVLIDNYALASNPQTMNINQININLYKYQNSGFTIWLDAKDVSSITKNTSNLVSVWNDKSGTDNDGIQNTTLNKPTYNSIDNSIFLSQTSDGVDTQYLNISPTTFNNTYYYTFSMVLKVPSSFSQGDILGKFLGTTRANICNLYITSTAFNFIANNGVTFTTNFITSITNNNKFLLTFSYNGNTFKVWQNGQLLLSSVNTTGNIPNYPTFDTSFDTCCIGGTNTSNVYIYELIYNETYLYEDEIQKIESYLCNKWGISNFTNPYINSIVSFTPNSVLSNNSIKFSTIDNNLTTTNSMTQLLINPTITYTTSYRITLSNWKPSITTVYLYVGINNKYYDRTMVQSLTVTHNTGNDTYYINLNVNSTKLTNNSYYFSLRDVNSDVFGFDLRVADPNSYFTIANASYMTLNISPTTCVLNQNNTLTITFTFSGSTPANIYLYSCRSIYTTGNVGSGSHDLTVITTLTTATDLTDNQATITFNPSTLPVYILASTATGFNGYYGYSNKLTLASSLSLRNTLPTSIIGKIDDINEFTVDLQPHYRNIQVNNSNIIINHTIDTDNNKIVFSYDSGFESDVTFNIINSKTNQIYDSLKVIFS